MTGLQLHGRARVGDFDLDIAIEAEPGQRTTLIGPNGSGKSTVLRLIAGLETLRSGSLVVDSHHLDAGDGTEPRSPQDRSVGMVFQDHRLFDHLDVATNVGFALEAKGVSSAQRRTVVAELLDAFDLASLANREPANLSGGQRARVALARAVAPKPQLLLLDEPFGAVDVETRSRLQQALLDNTPPDTITMMVTHDPVEARLLSDQMVVMEGGQTVQRGSPSDVAASPSTSFAADLLGTNLITGTSIGTEVTLASGATVVTATPADGSVHLTFSPSAITLHRDKPAGSARNVWPAEVANLVDLGGRIRVELAGPVTSAALVTPSAVADLDLAPGTSCWASLKATEIAVLPARS